MSTVEMPGLIDCHVHFREPGFTHKGTMQSEADAAVAGGVLTVCDMPNTNPPTVTEEAFLAKVALAEKITNCDIRLFFGITEASHIEELRKVHNHPRLCGVKLYLDHSTGNQKVDGGIISDIFAVCSELDLTLVAHCEDADMNAAALERNIDTDVSAHSRMRPPESEAVSIEYAIGEAAKHGTRFHVAHLSTAAGIALVRQAKREGKTVSCEVAPHHLFFTTDDYEQRGTLVKMNPPLRSQRDQDALWEGVRDGTIDCIATDHAPHTLGEKCSGPALSAPSGVPGVEVLLPLLVTAAKNGKINIDDIPKLCFENPNRIFGLHKDPQTITVDTRTPWTIHASALHSLCGWTPYEGMAVYGKVV